jgi:hypothetical protein
MLEQVVRPSQTPRIRPGHPTQILKTPKIPQNNPVVWGSSGSSIFEIQGNLSQEVPKPKWEESRTYDVVRVYNPDDREQFVDTEQMTEYQGRNKLGKDRFVMKFATNRNTENTEVIERGLVRNTPL